MRIGTGWDIHRLVPRRDLLLGGVHIPHETGEAGHSDGDVLLHAIIDALLGAVASGDIGMHFPPSDERWKDVSSVLLLERTLDMIAGYAIVNIDCTIILQRPKLRDHIDTIRRSIASICSVDMAQVSVKAKTAEAMLGEVGSGEAVIAQAVVLLQKTSDDGASQPDEWV